jgi:hypothetical protein
MEDFIAICKERATEAMDRFLHELSFVPADRLTWSPTPTAKSALQIAAHCAGYSGAFASIIRAGGFSCSREVFRSKVKSAIDSFTTLEEAETMLRQGTVDTIAALDTVKPEQVGAMVDAPQGKTPLEFFLTLPAIHVLSRNRIKAIPLLSTTDRHVS